MIEGVRLATAVSAFLAAGLFASIEEPSPATALPMPESRYTDLLGRTCETDAAGSPASSQDEQVKRCPGLGGAKVVVAADPRHVALGFEWSPRERVETVLREWDLGGRLEWRGLPHPRGFEPYAAVVGVRAGDDDAAPRILAIIRLRRGEACLLALIDPAGNPEAGHLAQRIADEQARNFVCGRDASRVEGVSTGRATTLLARL